MNALFPWSFLNVRGRRLLGGSLRQKRWGRFVLLAGSIAHRLAIYGRNAERVP